MAERGEPIRIGVRELRGKLGDYLRQAKSGARFLIMSRGKPVAELGAPYEENPKREPRRSGGLKGKIWMADDFDEWPQDILESFEKPL
jgi:antitoxin (DNA-binding transcriptional repressor) of toxin-antitoxin stability system